MAQVLPITDSVEFHFEGENAPIELLGLRDFWDCAQMLADDYLAIWEQWTETMSSDVYLEWYDLFSKRGGALRAEKALNASDQELANDPN